MTDVDSPAVRIEQFRAANDLLFEKYREEINVSHMWWEASAEGATYRIVFRTVAGHTGILINSLLTTGPMEEACSSTTVVFATDCDCNSQQESADNCFVYRGDEQVALAACRWYKRTNAEASMCARVLARAVRAAFDEEDELRAEAQSGR